MSREKVWPLSNADTRIGDDLKAFARRIEAVPPGMCPLVLQLSLLQTSEAQTCGKCVPCRDGIPRLTALLQKVVRCEAEEEDLEQMRLLAEMIRDTADCAIGFGAGDMVLSALAMRPPGRCLAA